MSCFSFQNWLNFPMQFTSELSL